MKRYQVYVTAKKGIFDPAGRAVSTALEQLGYSGVKGVRIGKYIELEATDDIDVACVSKMCERLLANPVIEEFRIEAVS